MAEKISTGAGRPRHRLPDILIIGAMKAGTTSLFHYLLMHPQITRGKKKEPAFFTDRHFGKGVQWYERLFPFDARLKVEASTNYAKYPNFDNVPARIADVLPDARLIYIVRHPVKRCISQVHHTLISSDNPAHHKYHQMDYWQDHGLHVINNSRYYMQISEYLKYFGRDQILLLDFEGLVADPVSVMNQVLEFLGLPADYYHDGMSFEQFNKQSTSARVRYPKAYKFLRKLHEIRVLPPAHRLLETPVDRPVFPAEIKAYLWDQVESDLRQFESLLGRSLNYAPLQ